MSTALNTSVAEPMFDRATIQKLQEEYLRTNPYNLPELCQKPRRRRIVRGHHPELVFSARPH